MTLLLHTTFKKRRSNLTWVLKGIAWYEYYGYLDIDEAKETIKQRLTAALSQLGDIDINDVDIAIY